MADLINNSDTYNVMTDDKSQDNIHDMVYNGLGKLEQQIINNCDKELKNF